MPIPYHSSRYMLLLLDPVLRSLVAAGFVEGAVFGGLVTWAPELTAMNPQGQIESNYDETVDNFDSMDLKPELLRGEFLIFIVRSQNQNICANIFIPGIYAYG